MIWQWILCLVLRVQWECECDVCIVIMHTMCVCVFVCDRIYVVVFCAHWKIPERQCVDMSTLLSCNSYLFLFFSSLYWLCLLFFRLAIPACHVVNQINIGGICKNTYCSNWIKFRKIEKKKNYVCLLYMSICLSVYVCIYCK